VLRIRWFDPEPDGQATPLVWPDTALITATLFLNFPFWYERGLYFWMPGTLLENAVVLGVLLIAVLFFAGPAFASYTSRRPLLAVTERSLGTVPVLAFRVCCICFLVVWIADLISWPASRFVTSFSAVRCPVFKSGAIAGALVIFIFVTGLQSFRTRANLALFSNKLGFALLVAAVIRVQDGLPAALKGFPRLNGDAAASISGHGLSLLALYVGPLVFLAADFGYRLQARKQVALTAAMGVVLPLFGTLLLVGLIGVATAASPYYQPSLEPTVAMALWSNVASSALPGRMMMAAITIFGASRFGTGALKTSVSIPNLGGAFCADCLDAWA
jgi:hypothetical protein